MGDPTAIDQQHGYIFTGHHADGEKLCSGAGKAFCKQLPWLHGSENAAVTVNILIDDRSITGEQDAQTVSRFAFREDLLLLFKASQIGTETSQQPRNVIGCNILK